MSAAFGALRVWCLCSAVLTALAAGAGCRHRSRAAVPEPESVSTRPAPALAGVYRAAREGVELMVEVRPEVRWSGYAVVRVKNGRDARVEIPRHATSVVHDFHLKVRDAGGQDVPARMMLKLDEPGRPTAQLALEPGATHEEGIQLGMLFALRAGESYVLSAAVPVRLEGAAEPVVITIDDARFSIVSE